MVSGGIAPSVILNPVTKGGEWRAWRFCCFTPKEDSTRYPLKRKLDGPWSWPGGLWKRENLVFQLGKEPQFLGRPCRSVVSLGRARAQAFSCRLPTAADRVRAQASSCGICGGQSVNGADFLPVLQFLLLFRIPPTAPHSSSIIRGWYNRPNSGWRTKWTQSHPTPRN
jgi:hypothetical protein